MKSMMSSLRIWADMVKLPHSVFALPFALMAAFLAGRTIPGRHYPFPGQIILVIMCMVSARSVAMTFNRIVDAAIDARNPRTARVMANRIWQYHFGRAIVPTPNEFGGLGEAASHPELLDWLASELIDGGWRLKRIHRAIVLSSAYQMSSRGSQAALARDPSNRWFWRFPMRRLTAEIGDYEIGCLQTDRVGFYDRLGWELWQGPLAGLFGTSASGGLLGGLIRTSIPSGGNGGLFGGLFGGGAGAGAVLDRGRPRRPFQAGEGHWRQGH